LSLCLLSVFIPFLSCLSISHPFLYLSLLLSLSSVCLSHPPLFLFISFPLFLSQSSAECLHCDS
jgi:hypothetical protein